MSDSPQKISREEFYQRIWKTPIVQLGKELGFSYVEMIRLCEALNVPRPEAGHWYRLKHGGAEEKIALPAPGPNIPAEIVLKPKENPVAALAPTQVPPPEVSPTVTVAEPETQQPVESEEFSETESNEDTVATVSYTREQLCEAIWTTSCQKLAASLGISDVALAKTCKRLGIPRPSLGYWARVAAGEKLKRTPLLSPQAGQNRTVSFDVAANLRRQKEQRAEIKLEELAVDLAIPSAETPLHPLAQRHQHALEKKKPDDSGFVRVGQNNLFRCDVTPANVPRLYRALHALFVELEARGYKFKPGAEQYSNLQIVKGEDAVTILCAEGTEKIGREPTAEDKRRPSWTWQLKQTRPTGKLSFEIQSWGLRGRRTWSERDNKPLEEILGVLVEKIDSVFFGFEEQRRLKAEAERRRAEEAKREAEEQAQEEKRAAERERQQRHRARLSEIIKTREENLLMAAALWMESENLKAFIEICEMRWRQSGELSKDQSTWLSWAREQAVKLHPFTRGFPDAVSDGPFDPESIPMGGPYPKAWALKEPKPSPPTPVEIQKEVHTVYVEQPYPFWRGYRKY